MHNHPLLIDNLNVAIFLVNPQSHIIQYANTAAETLVGRSLSYLKKHRLNEILIHENDWQAIFSEAPNNQLLIERSSQLATPYNQNNISADIAINCNYQGFILIEIQSLNRAQEIAKTKNIEHQANHNQLIIRNLAHEIRNPLASMKAATQRLYDIEDETKKATYLDLILSQIDRLNQLLKQMTGESKMQFANNNIHQIIEESINLINHHPQHQSIKIIREYDPSIPDLPLDSGLIAQVINNLLNNAIKASDYQGIIKIKTSIEHQYTINHTRHKSVVKIAITDFGCGIPENLQNAIFQPMISHFKNGSGLGLAIVQNIIKQHQGSINLSSNSEQTTFSIHLPIQRNPS